MVVPSWFRSSTRARATAPTWSTSATAARWRSTQPRPARAASGHCAGRGLTRRLRRRHPPPRRLPHRRRELAADGRRARSSPPRPAAGSSPHAGWRDGDEVDLGGLPLRALATPGHTAEHLVLPAARRRTEPVGVFTGGSLMVGAAARTDLVDPDRTEELARAQYQSLQRLLTLPDDVARVADPRRRVVLLRTRRRRADHHASAASGPPTRCCASPTRTRSSRSCSAALGSFPAYFARLPELNRRGPRCSAPLAPARRSTPTAAPPTARPPAPSIVDVRPVDRRSPPAHMPGSLSIPLRACSPAGSAGSPPPDRAAASSSRDADQDPDEIVWQAAKIGYDNIVGELAGGIDAWSRGRPAAPSALALVGAGRASPAPACSTSARTRVRRRPHPRRASTSSSARSPARADQLADGPIVVMCGHGERA